MWACPHCQQPLLERGEGNSLHCDNGHSFDRAREGYVNLLPSHRKGSRQPGDDAQMVAARRRVHEQAVYQPLAEAIVAQFHGLPQAGTVLDLGCGEGYYSAALCAAAPQLEVQGIDISRPAIRLAARHCKAASFAVASAFGLPLADNAVDAVLRVFAPADDVELVRVLKPGALYLEVSPAPRHLWELRRALYAAPREHPPARSEIAGMQLRGSEQLQFEVTPAPGLLSDIVAMTPYAHRGQGRGPERLAPLEASPISLAFTLRLFQSEG